MQETAVTKHLLNVNPAKLLLTLVLNAVALTFQTPVETAATLI